MSKVLRVLAVLFIILSPLVGSMFYRVPVASAAYCYEYPGSLLTDVWSGVQYAGGISIQLDNNSDDWDETYIQVYAVAPANIHITSFRIDWTVGAGGLDLYTDAAVYGFTGVGWYVGSQAVSDNYGIVHDADGSYSYVEALPGGATIRTIGADIVVAPDADGFHAPSSVSLDFLQICTDADLFGTDTPTATSSPTVTRTPTAPASTPIPGFTPGCIPGRPTSTPGGVVYTSTPFGASTATPGPSRTPSHTRTPGPSPTRPASTLVPPLFGYSFDSGLSPWVAEGKAGWLIYGHNAPGSAFLGGTTIQPGYEQANLVLAGPWDASWGIRGYMSLADVTDLDGTISLIGQVFGRVNGAGAPGWHNGDPGVYYQNVDIAILRTGQWVPFVVIPARPTGGSYLSDITAFRFGLSQPGLGSDTYAAKLFLDDLVIFNASNGSGGGGGIGICGTPVGTPAVVPTINTGGCVNPSNCIGVTQIAGDDPCLGYSGVSVAVPTNILGGFGVDVPGVRVCFQRYEVGSIVMGGLDFTWFVVIGFVALPVFVIIQFIRATAK